jgi:Protein of unknown function (DUF3012)
LSSQLFSGLSNKIRAHHNHADIHFMNTTTRLAILCLTALTVSSLWGCAPEVGSDEWCANLKEKPKGDWSLNEATDYAKHCIIK